MPDSLQEQIPSSIQLRAQLEAMVRRDLLGPAGGPKEEVDERAVRGRYILDPKDVYGPGHPHPP
jgi:hypothetical protein